MGGAPTESSAWASLRERIAWVRRLRKLVAADQARLAEAITHDVGKPYAEALTADILPLISACRWLERYVWYMLGERKIVGGGMLSIGQRHVMRREPVGRVAIIATWNYPVQLLGIQLAQALIAGNRVVVKPSEHSPVSQGVLIGLAQQAGLPEGVLTATEATREAGERLLAEQRFDHVVFTGSTAVGRAIARTLADTLTPSTLELSGRDSAIVLGDADVRLAAASIATAFTANAGQTCMAPKRAIVSAAAREGFLEALEARLDRAKPRSLISAGAAHEAWSQAKAAIDAGGERIGHVPPEPDGRTLAPIAIARCPVDSALARGENFGPVLAVIDAASDDDAVAIHGRFDQHLATSVYTRKPKRAKRFAGVLGSSVVTINDAVIPVAHPAASLGGRGPSGWGMSRGPAGVFSMTRRVQVTVTSPRIRPPADLPEEPKARKAGGWIAKIYGLGVPPPTIPIDGSVASGGRDGGDGHSTPAGRATP